MAHGVEARTLFVVGLDHSPRSISRIGMKEHGLFGARIIFPAIQGGQIHGRQFPLLQGMMTTLFKTATLLLPCDGKPELHQIDATVD